MRRRTAACLLTTGATGVVVAFVVPSNASGGTSVALRESSPSGRITAEVGDAVRFTNEDDQQHVLRSASGNWSFSLTLAPGESARVPAPLGDEPASYVLTDSYIAGEGASPRTRGDRSVPPGSA